MTILNSAIVFNEETTIIITEERKKRVSAVKRERLYLNEKIQLLFFSNCRFSFLTNSSLHSEINCHTGQQQQQSFVLLLSNM